MSEKIIITSALTANLTRPDQTAYPMAAQSLIAGGHVRVGMEDSVYLARGVHAPSNAALVEKARSLIELLGAAVASAGEARLEVLMTAGSNVLLTENILYVRRGERELTGTLYSPKEARNAPVVVAVHGGGWKRGDRSFYRHVGPYLAQSGIALFSVDYRLTDASTGAYAYPAAVHDVGAAVQYVRLHAQQFGLDPERIGLMGDSAGAHLAFLASLAGDLRPLPELQTTPFPM